MKFFSHDWKETFGENIWVRLYTFRKVEQIHGGNWIDQRITICLWKKRTQINKKKKKGGKSYYESTDSNMH